MRHTFLEKITHLGVFKYLEKKRFIQYALDFEQTLRQLEEYLHVSDDQEEIINGTLETACEFYQGDWCGFIEVDMDLGLWTTTEWFNKGPDDKTKDLLNEFESSDVWQRWIEAIKENHPLIIEDVEAIKEKYPDEYDAYKRLSVDSLIAVPFRPRPLGVVVIRNPKRYIGRSSMLQMLAFVALTAVNEKKLFERARMAWSPEDIKCDNDIIINLFGELEIYTSHGVMREVDIKSPKASKLLVYLLMNRGKTIPPRTIVEEVWPDEVDDSDNIGRNIKNLVCRFRKNFKVLSDEDLIVSMPTGYCINPKLNIMTDLQLFDKYFKMAHETTSIATKIEFLVKGMDVYKGKLLPEAAHELWMVSTAVHYHYHYTGNDNWSVLADTSYDMAERLAEQEFIEELLSFITEKQRIAMIRYYIDEESHEEIAADLGISRQAVTDTIAKAIRRIRMQYGITDKRIVSQRHLWRE